MWVTELMSSLCVVVRHRRHVSRLLKQRALVVPPALTDPRAARSRRIRYNGFIARFVAPRDPSHRSWNSASPTDDPSLSFRLAPPEPRVLRYPTAHAVQGRTSASHHRTVANDPRRTAGCSLPGTAAGAPSGAQIAGRSGTRRGPRSPGCDRGSAADRGRPVRTQPPTRVPDLAVRLE